MRKLSRKFYSRELSVSTEPEENTDPDKYPAVFWMKPEQLANLPITPRISPARGRLVAESTAHANLEPI